MANSITNKSRSQYSMMNALLGGGLQFLSYVLIFTARIVFIKFLGVDILGINALFESILIVLSLADLGFGTAVAYSLYKPLAENDKSKIRTLMAFYKKVYRLLALTIFTLGLCVLPLIPFMVDVSIPFQDLAIFYIIMLASSAVSYLFAYRHMLIAADQKTYIVKIYTTGFTALRVAVQIAALVIWQSYIAWLVVHLISTVVLNIVLANKATRMYPFITEAHDRLDSKSRKSIMSDVKSLFMYRFSGVVINTSDNVIGSIIAGTVVIGLYSNYYLIVGALTTFFNSQFSALTASIGNLVTSNDREKSYSVFRALNLLTFWIVGLISVAMMLVLNDVVTLWLGPEVLFSVALVVTIAVIFYFQSTAAPLWAFRDGTGMFRQFRYIGFYMAGLNIVLSIIFGLLWGFIGILLATLLSRLLTVYWYTPLQIYRKYFNRTLREYMIMRLRYSFVVVMSLIFSYFATAWVQEVTIASVILKLTVISAIVTLIFILVFGRTEEAKRLMVIFSKVFKKLAPRSGPSS